MSLCQLIQAFGVQNSQKQPYIKPRKANIIQCKFDMKHYSTLFFE